MFNQAYFGKRLKMLRRRMNLTQNEVASKIGVSEQAVSKWENGECLPDVYNLRLLSRLLRISADCLLDTENDGVEKVIETIKTGGAVFEIVEKPETILAGKILYAKDYKDINEFHSAVGAVSDEDKRAAYALINESVLPIYDIHLSINFWREKKLRGFGFVREAATEEQPSGVDVCKMPASLFIRAYTDKQAAQLVSKEQCEIWELFAYIRNFFMPAHGFKMSDNGAQEMEVFDTSEHKTGYAYMPVRRI